MDEVKYKENIVEIELLLRKVCFNIKQKGREILEDYSITPPQFDALQLLVYEGDMTVGELSARLYLAPSTLTDLIDRMEKNEHVAREREVNDRRVVKIKALEKGRILINDVISRRCGYINELLENVDENATKDLIKYLNILDSKPCE
jgi:DNA-binding MarR family transcriptional regulator